MNREVKRIFFNDEGLKHLPKFEMEDGEIKMPIPLQDENGVMFMGWLTKDELIALVESNQPKEEDTKPKIEIVRG